ncbi:MAG: hydroxyacid dehydrogenase [Pseudomonadota bacterium]
MSKTPVTALVMHPVVRDEILRWDHMERLDRACHLLGHRPVRSPLDLQDACAELEVMITSWGAPRITVELAEAFPKLKLIAHMAGSVKGFIDEGVFRRGIRVTNAVGANAQPVAEFTLAAILFANKRVIELSRIFTRDRENRAPWVKEAPNVGNYRKAVGIVGASHVGRIVLSLLRPFELRVLLYDPYVSPLQARDMGATKVGMTELLAQSDVVSLHAPLLDATRGMLGARELALMPDGATLINTARGALIDTQALEAELISGRLHAMLDTTDPAELSPDSPLFELPNVFLTPHIAGSLGTETQRLADQVVSEVERFARGSALQHQVKREQLSRLA